MNRLEKVFLLLASLLLLSFIYSVVFSFPLQWDFLCYHLPAALGHFKLTTFSPGKRLTEVIAGYPPIPHYLQGLLIYLTGSPFAANWIGFLSLGGLLGGFYFTTRNLAKIMWALFLFLCIPLFSLHLTSPFVDLWSAAWLGLAVYYAFLILIRPFQWSSGGLFCVFAFIASMSKMQNWPVIACLCLFIGLVWLKRLVKDGLSKSNKKLGLLLIVVSLMVSLWPLRNWVVFHNPTHPWAPPVVQRFVPPDQYMIVNNSQSPNVLEATPRYLWSAPQSLKFVLSVFELGRVVKPRIRYRHDMWESGPDSVHHRMGGWGIWLVLFLIFWSYKWYRREPTAALIPLLGFSFLFVGISFIPQSHELRYWLFFPVALILCLVDLDFGFIRNHQRIIFALFILTFIFTIKEVGFRPRSIEQAAPPEARQFWKEASREEVYIIQNPPNEIFWSGPDFKTFKVISADY